VQRKAAFLCLFAFSCLAHAGEPASISSSLRPAKRAHSAYLTPLGQEKGATFQARVFSYNGLLSPTPTTLTKRLQ